VWLITNDRQTACFGIVKITWPSRFSHQGDFSSASDLPTSAARAFVALVSKSLSTSANPGSGAGGGNCARSIPSSLSVMVPHHGIVARC